MTSTIKDKGSPNHKKEKDPKRKTKPNRKKMSKAEKMAFMSSLELDYP